MDDPPAVIDCVHPAGGRYETVWVFATRGAHPLGLVELPVSTNTLLGHEVVARLRAELADWTPPPGPPIPTTRLPGATVVVATDLRRPADLLACVRHLVELDYP